MGLPSGFYREELNKGVWEVPDRYQNLSAIGTGAYGQVCSALDTATNTKVAIKKLSRPFQSLIHAKRAYRETRLLRHMNHENVINLLDIFTPHQNLRDFTDVYFVTVLMDADLSKIIRAQVLSDEHVHLLVYQILRALKYIHSAGIIHRDLKPGNVAVKENGELKILDFGLARSSDDLMSGYVATRWYRAPEVILNYMQYNSKVDIWSTGCIMAELLSGKPLFPGDDEIDQLTKIMQLVGKPSDKFLEKITSQNAKVAIQAMPAYAGQNFGAVFRTASSNAIDILKLMLALDPDERPSAEQALAHAYFQSYHDPDDEPTAEPFPKDGEAELGEATIERLKGLLFNEIRTFVPPLSSETLDM